jgi:hypothetical protein
MGTLKDEVGLVVGVKKEDSPGNWSGVGNSGSGEGFRGGCFRDDESSLQIQKR